MSKKGKGQAVSAETRAKLVGALERLARGEEPRRVATELAEGDERLGLELAAALAAEESEQAARLAQALSQTFAASKARRAFKRTLYLLEQKCFRVERPEGEPAVLKAPEPPRLPAYVSLPDPVGHQMVIAAVPGHDGLDACLCSVSPEGVEHFVLVAVPRRGLREIAAHVEEDSRLPVAETGPDHARLLLEEARDRAAERGRGVPAEFAPFLRALSAFAPKAERPPVYGLLEEAEVAADSRLRQETPRLLEGVGVLWHLPEADVKPYVLKLEAAEQSGLVLTAEQRAERLQAIFEEAAGELFDPKRRLAWRRRLEESAYVLARRGKAAEARLALAGALEMGRMESGREGEWRPGPLVLAIASRSMLPLLKEAQEAKDSSLIIKP